MADINTFAVTTGFLELVEEPESRRAALADESLRWQNYGYQKICDEYIKPSIWAEITLDSEKKFLLSTLVKPFREVRKVSLYKDGSADAGYGISSEYPYMVQDGYLIVPHGVAGGTMWLRYYYYAPTLTMATSAADTTATTIPSLIVPDVRRMDLRFIVAAKYGARRGKFATKAPYWEEQFIAAFKDMREPMDSVNMQIRNKYPSQPRF